MARLHLTFYSFRVPMGFSKKMKKSWVQSRISWSSCAVHLALLSFAGFKISSLMVTDHRGQILTRHFSEILLLG